MFPAPGKFLTENIASAVMALITEEQGICGHWGQVGTSTLSIMFAVKLLLKANGSIEPVCCQDV